MMTSTSRSFVAVSAGILLAMAAATVSAETTSVTGSKGRSFHTCLQLLVSAVGQGENCTYGGTPVIPLPPLGDPVEQNPGPFSQGAYYDSSNPVLPPFTSGAGGITSYIPTQNQNDGKISPVINGSVTVTGTGEGALISFELTFTSPDGGDIIRHQGAAVADRYTSMTQVLTEWPVDSATPNAFGGFDYVIGSQGFPERLVFNNPNGSPCNGQLFGEMECSSSFLTLGQGDDGTQDRNRWDVRPGPAGLGSLEGNTGARTTGTLTGAACADNGVPNQAGATPCRTSKTSFAPLLELNGPNATPGTGTAETVGWDNLLLKISTDSSGRVVAGAGFDVQGYQTFGADLPCGSDPGATQACNSWSSGYFTLSVPTAVDDGPVSVVRGNPVEIDVLANDINFIDPVTLAITVPPGQGVATIEGLNPGPSADLRIIYTADPDAEGGDSFEYSVTGGDGVSTDTATVSIIILDIGANDDTATTRRNTPVVIPIGANDSFESPVTATIVSAPENGTVVLSGSPGPASGITATYTPSSAPGTPTFTDQFVYRLDDGEFSDEATVTISVTNVIPSAIGGTISSISTQGFDPSTRSGSFTAPGPGGSLGDTPATVVVTMAPGRGSTSVAGNVITFVPAADFFSGDDTFTYTITDADGETSSAEVTVTIPNLTPAIAPGSISTTAGTPSAPFTPSITAGNGSPAQHQLQVTTQGSLGSCAVSPQNATGTVVYTPNAGASGSDSCVLTLTDGDGSSATATISVTIADSGVGGPSGILPDLRGGSAVHPAWSGLLGLLALLRLRRSWR
ncbi:MAG: hypothetical protein JJT85_10085 [Chromatiales bacterium]|nr:hypothetical protein [Chromatiales bacterium]